MNGQAASSSGGHRALLWVARIMGTLIVLFCVMMMIGYAVNPHEPVPEDFEMFLLALFPIGMCVGYLVAWKWPLIGGVVSLVCLATFLVALGEADMILTIAFLSIPGVLFVVYGVLRRRLSTVPSAD